MKRIALAASLAAGCSTPYQRMGVFSGGYEDHPLGGGRFAVHVEVNGYTSEGTALEYAYRRAGELCPSGFDTLDGSRSADHSYYIANGVANEVTKPRVSVIVQCRRTTTCVAPNDCH